MANPRQRRKSRSSSHKPVHQSRRAKKILKKQPAIRGPKVLQEAWDKRKTVRQNYAALGLAASLNPRTSGGVERVATSSEEQQNADDGVDMACTEAQNSSKRKSNAGDIPKGHGRIVRDAEGNIIGLELGDEEEEAAAADVMQGQLVEDRASAITPETSSWVSLGRDPGQAKSHTDVVEALEKVSSSSGRVPRFSSTSEVLCLQRLISRYQEDVDAMAHDRKLNPDQRTAGELNRAIRKAGGFQKLSAPVSRT